MGGGGKDGFMPSPKPSVQNECNREDLEYEFGLPIPLLVSIITVLIAPHAINPSIIKKNKKKNNSRISDTQHFTQTNRNFFKLIKT